MTIYRRCRLEEYIVCDNIYVGFSNPALEVQDLLDLLGESRSLGSSISSLGLSNRGFALEIV